MSILSKIGSLFIVEDDDKTMYPKVAIVKIHKQICAMCLMPIEDGDVIVWYEKKSGWKSDIAHARCKVVIKSDIGFFKIDGTKLESVPTEAMLLTQDQWDSWF